MPVLSRIEVRAIDKGKLLQARGSVIKVLEACFETVSEELKEAINQLEDISYLEDVWKVIMMSIQDIQIPLNPP